MEGVCQLGSTKLNKPHGFESLAKSVVSESVQDYVKDRVGLNGTLTNHQSVDVVDSEVSKCRANLSKLLSCESTVQANKSHQSHSISVNMAVAYSGLYIGDTTKSLFLDNAEQVKHEGQTYLPSRPSIRNFQQPNLNIYSQSIPPGSSCNMTTEIFDSLRRSKSERVRDKRFDSFKTWSGRLERQLSNLRGRPLQEEPESSSMPSAEIATLPVERYFDALEGPELDVLKPSEEPALPEDKLWPFFLRFPISTFGICLGVSSQAILWKTLATSPSTKFLHISLSVNLVLWCIALALMISVIFIYLLKVLFYFEAVRREYYHPVRVNFFFAPWIACLFLAIGVPPSIVVNLQSAIWYMLMAPILCLELKLYGQWMSGGQRRLSKVANPSNHLSIVGNFVGALLGASMGLKEGPIFFFAVGLAHYIVLFVTLYQRLPTNETLPKELHPVFFLFVAAPSVACMAWAKIRGDFDYGSRIAYFIAIFLYLSLAVRVNFFRGFRFSLAWWAYTFPMTGAAIATIRDLFPNDISIAITESRPKLSKKRIRLIWGGPYGTAGEASVAVDIHG